jgi:type III pantothenate kinase
MKCLVVDIGNTSTAVGVYQNGAVRKVSRLSTANPGIRAVRRILSERIDHRVKAAILSTVVPKARALWDREARRHLGGSVYWLNSRTPIGIKVSLRNPKRIGTDRLATVSGAAAKYGAPTIVIDTGTAMVFDVIRPSKGHVGGVICAGLPLLLDALADRTALLPRLSPEKVSAQVGRSTKEAMQLGAAWGQIGAAKEVLARLRRPFGRRKVAIVVTGGDATWLGPALGRSVIVDETLTLFGLGHIGELNWG